MILFYLLTVLIRYHLVLNKMASNTLINSSMNSYSAAESNFCSTSQILRSIVSFNLHGYNQGQLELTALCNKKRDIIFLQELWLSSNKIYESLDFLSEDYHIFCV